MKPHLPLSLLKSLCVAVAAGYTVVPVQAAMMHTDVHLQTYTDFGQNKGRYVTGQAVSSLLAEIRKDAGGITIPYTDGTGSYTISNAQGMINYAGTGDNGAYAAIAPNMVASVLHNGALNASFGERVVGAENAINYDAIDIRHSSVFRLSPPDGMDYMLQRQSKVATDAVWYTVADLDDPAVLTGSQAYHSGAGSKSVWEDGAEKGLSGAYNYIIGGINNIGGAWFQNGLNSSHTIYQDAVFRGGEGATEASPLPSAPRSGDSGSPVYIYNESTRQYEYAGAQQTTWGTSGVNARGNSDWTLEALQMFDKKVEMSDATSTVYLNAVIHVGDTYSDTVGATTYGTTMHYGRVTDASGKVLQTYNGINGETWKDLSDQKKNQQWYAYSGYLNQSDEDLFYTENLVFSSSAAKNRIVLKDTVDLGIGYAEFKSGDYTIVSEGAERNRFNHAGYVIHEGASVHLQLVNPDSHMTEWRKTGAGDLYIDGSGDTNALLNLGGSGKTYLQQSNGYAAYNVLVNTGAEVVIQDKGQIARDFTFGSGGGTLDMNGVSMDWYTSYGETRDGFTINALTDEALITNSSETAVRLVYRESGDTVFKGSFSDADGAGLHIEYAGGADSTWTLNSLHTELQGEKSGLSVTSGKVILSGTLTEHGMGSGGEGITSERLVRENDWHYADSSMTVTVNGGAFELGSHARLTGDVTVENGGRFIMREGVQHAMEYVEGGVEEEATSKYAAFYGLKGDVQLKSGATMEIGVSAGTTALNSYAGAISGEGSVLINHADCSGAYKLSGTNTFTGAKTVQRGGLIVDSLAALGDTSDHQWVVEKGGWMASHADGGSVALLGYIDQSSTGALALTQDVTDKIDLSSHASLFLGAESGKVVNYGRTGTNETLASPHGSWKFGAGGELVVHYQLTGESQLIVGADRNSSGVVTLTNTANDYSGGTMINGGTLRAQSLSQLGTGSIVVNSGANLESLEVFGASVDMSRVTGSGNLALNLSATGSAVALGDGFTGATRVLTGCLDISGSNNINDVVLEDGTSLRASGGLLPGGLVVQNGVEIHGEAGMHVVSGTFCANGAVTGDGMLVKTGEGTLYLNSGASIQSANTYTGGTIIEAGVLKVSRTGALGTGDITINGGSLIVNGSGNKVIASNVTINKGGVLRFGDSGNLENQLDTSVNDKRIALNGSTLDLGKSYQTMGTWKLRLNNGAEICGPGRWYDDSDNTAALYFDKANTITATAGESLISADSRIASGVKLVYDVSNGATLTVSGRIFSDGSGNGSLVKDGDGTLIISNQENSYKGGTTINSGTVLVDATWKLGSGNTVVEKNGTLELSGVKSGKVSFGSKISGEGTLALTFNDAVGNTVAASDAYQGTTYVKGGRVELAGSSFGHSLRLGDGAAAVLSEQSNVSLRGNLELEAGSSLRAEGAARLQVDGVASLAAGSLDVQAGSTLELAGSSYTFGSGEFLAADNAGSVHYTAAGLQLEYDAITTLNGAFKVAGDTSLYMQRGTDGQKWKTHGLNVAGEMTVASGKTLSITGNARLQVNEGARLALEDKSAINRTSAGAFYIKGSLAVEKDAVASFTSVDDVHLNYDNAVADNGSIDVAAGSTLQLSVKSLQSYGQAAINVAEKATLDARGTDSLQLSNKTAVNLQKDARLMWKDIEFSNKGDADKATLTNSGSGAYGLGSTDYVLTDGYARYTGSDATLRTQLAHSEVEHAGSGVLKVYNSQNSLSGVHASSGSIKLFDKAVHELESLSVGDRLAVSAYKEVYEQAAQYAALHVSGLADFGSGATLNADMVLQSGAVVDMGGTVMLDGVLTLQAGLRLDGAVLDAVQGLVQGGSYTLFTGVNGLNLEQTVTLDKMPSLAARTVASVSYSPLMDGVQVEAADYFSNLAGNSGLVLSYNSTAGTVTITQTSESIPEPATATLSLLALAALCARRRRK